MISGLKIGNFKAFGAAQEIPLRPLTLVFGPNSAGKSSIIQALLLARHIQDTGNVDAHQTTLGGGAIDLGGFTRFVHYHDESREVTIHFSIKRSDLRGKFHDLDQFETLTISYVIGGCQRSKTIRAIAISLDGSEARRLTRMSDGALQIDPTPITDTNPLAPHDYASRIRRSVKSLLGNTFEWPASANDRTEMIEEFGAAKFRADGLALRILNPLPRTGFYTTDDLAPEEHDADSHPHQFFAHLEKAEDGLGYAEAIARWHNLSGFSREERDAEQWPDETPRSCAKAIRFMFERLIEAANEALIRGLTTISYLGPLRWIPPRQIPEGEQFDASWTAGGGDAWQRLRRERELLDRVNHFLRDTLRSRYRLECQHFALVKSAAASATSSRVAEDPELAATQRAQNADETLTTLSIVEADTGLTVSHRDVGTGISQLLPVLVNAAGSKERLIMIEQPELHLHPALQAELGDVFIESALGENKNTFLIETHSEHLILRLLRRIRETATGELPPGMTPILPEHIAVLYVRPGAEGSEVIELPVNAEGDFDAPWPDGFFPERAKELF